MYSRCRAWRTSAYYAPVCMVRRPMCRRFDSWKDAMEDCSPTVVGESHCPHCDAQMDDHALVLLPGSFIARRWHCLFCGGHWNEMRDVLTTTRYWTPLPTTVPTDAPCPG
jgi:hypothetical protein